MRHVRLGQTELQVSAVAFGTWAFGGDWGAADLEDGKASIHRALELGINLFDTAQGYGFGTAERMLGEALRDRARREEVVIATKGGLRMDGDRLVRDASARWLREGVESSLRDLGTDYIDLYQVHWPDPHTPAEETAEALQELVDAGKIRHVGVSNYGVDELEQFREFGRLEALQPPYHRFRRDMTPAATFAPDDWRSKSPDFTGERFRRNLQVVQRLKEFAQQRVVVLPELAVAWTLAHPAVDVAIVGAHRPSQLDGTATAADLHLSDEDLGEIDAILADALPVWGPHPEGM